MKKKKATCIDEFPACMIKDCAKAISQPRFLNDGMSRTKFSFQNRILTVQLLISEKGTLTVHLYAAIQNL